MTLIDCCCLDSDRERLEREREREKERKRETVGHPSSLIGRLHWEFVIQIETRILPDIKQLQIKSIIASVDKRERARGKGRESGEGGGVVLCGF